MHPREPDFDSLLTENRFVHEKDWTYHGSRYVRDSGTHCQAYVSWYGGPYNAGQLIPGRGNVPHKWLVRERISPGSLWTTAISPLIFQSVESCVNNKRDDIQVRQVLEWMSSVGFSWLNEPDRFTVGQWAERRLYAPETLKPYLPIPSINEPDA